MQFDTTQLELSVGGAILLWGNSEIKDKLNDVYIHDFNNADIAEIVKIHIDNGCNNNITVSKITADPTFRELYIKMMSSVITSRMFDDELQQLKEMSSKKRVRDEVGKLLVSVDDHNFTPEKLIEVAEQERGLQNNKIQSAWLDERIETFGNRKRKVPCFLQSINAMANGGFNMPSLVIVGASPSTGKTALAVQQMDYIASKGGKVMFFSLEMDGNQLSDRYISLIDGIHYGDIDKGKLSEEDKEKGRIRLRKIKAAKNPIIIDDVYYIEQIVSQIRQEKPVIAIIDYLQVVSSYKKHKDVRLLMDYIVWELKRCAKDVGCTIMLLSQLKRATGAESRLPTLFDLKESSGIEQNGDYIMLMHRPYVADKKAPPEQLKIVMAKNKFGECGLCELYFDGSKQRITDIQR